MLGTAANVSCLTLTLAAGCYYDWHLRPLRIDTQCYVCTPNITYNVIRQGVVIIIRAVLTPATGGFDPVPLRIPLKMGGPLRIL